MFGFGEGQFRAARPRNDPPIHRGVDLSGALNETAVLANRDGTVHFAGNAGQPGGLLVEIDHAGGTETGYVHLQATSIPADVVTGGSGYSRPTNWNPGKHWKRG